MATDNPIARHYDSGDLAGRDDLADTLLAAARSAAADPHSLTIDDFAPLDEFHVRGRAATLEFAQALGFAAGDHLLDIGCGLGGPARRIATVSGATVTGIDITPSYIAAAERLTTAVGMTGQAVFQIADACDLPFSDAVFDGAFTIHAAMNIADRPALYAEIARVLKPGATFGLHDICQGPGGDPSYPTPWAADADDSFLKSPDEVADLVTAAGFAIRARRDKTDDALAWIAAMQTRLADQGRPKIGLHVLMGERFWEMFANMAANFTDGKTVLTEIVGVRK